MLKDYKGPVLTDHFSGYNRLKNETKFKVVYCWAHARRNFYDLRENHIDDCLEIVTLIDQLLDVERKGGSFEALTEIGREESVPLSEKIKKWLEEKSRKYLLSDDDMSKAILYLLKAWTEFTLFLSDIRIPMTNNHAERSLRHGVLGRKILTDRDLLMEPMSSPTITR